jgi:chromosome segregation ATPase
VAQTYDRPDLPALDELERILTNLTDELAAWRRRSLKAEAELKEAQANGGVVAGPALKDARQRVIELETENQSLRLRIDGAKERLRELAARLAFLEQHGGGTAA